MSVSVYRLFSLVVLNIIVLNEFGSAIRIVTEPQVLIDKTDQLNVTCIADEPTYSTKKILTIEIVKQRQDESIIRMDHPHHLQAGPGFDRKKLKSVNGKIDQETNKNFLTLILDKPSIPNAIAYRCHVFFVDEDNRLGDENVIGNVTFQGCAGWTHYKADQTCLKVFGKDDNSKYLTWAKARKACQIIGGDLVQIQDEEKNKFVLDMTANLAYGPYIGVTNVAKVGFHFQYVDGSPLKTYHPWRKEHPADDQNEQMNKCVSLNSGTRDNGTWEDVYCKHVRPYVCSVPSQ